MYCLENNELKICDYCKLCKYIIVFITMLYDKILTTNNKDNFITMNVEIIIPVIRTVLEQWFDIFYDKLTLCKNLLVYKNDSDILIINLIKEFVEKDKKDANIFITHNSGLICIEITKTFWFKNLIQIINE